MSKFKFILLTFLLACTSLLFANNEQVVKADSLLNDTIKNENLKPIMNSDSVQVGMDSSFIKSADTLSVRTNDFFGAQRTTSRESENALDDDIIYSAKDSIVMEGTKKVHLYGEANVKYGNITLKANYVRLSLDSSTVYACGTKDSTGKLVGKPVFSEGGESYESKAMNYNFQTKKGFIWGTVTDQGDGFITSERTKRVSDDTYCLGHGRYTTCDHHDHPHFYLALTKAKMKQGKYIVSGPAYLVVEDIPLPLAIPFGYFPINKTYSSGILFPNFGSEASRGFFAKGLGYYFAINDYVDLAITGDIYTKGSWAVNLASSYKLRYKFSGRLNLSFLNNVYGSPNTPGYSLSRDFRVMWTHTQDQKMSPNTTFSASVNFSTSSYEQNNVDSYYNPDLVSQNTKSSTVTLQQKIPNTPLTVSASLYVNQRTSDSTLNLQLPTLNLNMSRVYPFKRKKPVGKEKWYEKIALNYTMAITNSITAKESEIMNSDFLRDWKNGIKQTLPISASFTFFKYLNFNVNFNNTLKWYFKKVDQSWEGDVAGSVVRDTTLGFYNVYQSDISAGFQTQLFGFYTLKSKSGKKMPIFRHKFTPSVSFTYAPDFGSDIWGYWGSYQRPTSTGVSETVYYDKFSTGVYGGSPSRGARGSISFGIANSLEMKYWSKNDSTGKAKKISIIDNFSVSTAYNVMADSLNWSDIAMNVRLKFHSKFSLNLNMTFDPYTYALNDFGSPVKVNVSQVEKNKLLFRLKSASTSFGYTFSNETFKKKKKPIAPVGGTSSDLNSGNPDEIPLSALEKNMNELNPVSREEERAAKRAKEDAEYKKFKMPWSLTLSYSVRYAYDTFNKDIMEYDRKLTHNLNISGSINLTDTWRFTMTTYYDITNNNWSYMSCTISKDLHCWQMSASFVPIGRYSTYNFVIGVKSTLLKDLKYEKESDASNRISWY